MQYLKYLVIALQLVSYALPAQHLTLVTEHLAPFQIVHKDQTITGVSTEIVREIFARTPFSYSIDASDWASAYNQVLKKTDVCIYSIARLPSRDHLVQWVGEIARSSTPFYSLRERQISLKSFDDARRYTVAVIDQDVSHHFLLTKGFENNKNLYALGNYDALLEMLDVRQDSIDLVMLNDELLLNRLGSISKMQKYTKQPVVTGLRFDFNLACSLKTSPNVVAQLTKSLDSMKADGTLQKIKLKWQPYLTTAK